MISSSHLGEKGKDPLGQKKPSKDNIPRAGYLLNHPKNSCLKGRKTKKDLNKNKK